MSEYHFTIHYLYYLTTILNQLISFLNVYPNLLIHLNFILALLQNTYLIKCFHLGIFIRFGVLWNFGFGLNHFCWMGFQCHTPYHLGRHGYFWAHLDTCQTQDYSELSHYLRNSQNSLTEYYIFLNYSRLHPLGTIKSLKIVK